MSKRKSSRKKANRPVRKPARGARADILTRLRKTVEANPYSVDARLALAEYCLAHDLERDIPDILAAVTPDDPKQKSRCRRMLAFGQAASGRYVEAERLVAAELEDDPDSLDGCFVRAFVHLSLREYEAAAEAARSYVARRQKEREEGGVTYYTTTDGYLSQAYNFLGSAAWEQGETQTAEENFEQAIDAEPSNHLPYLNYVNLLLRTEQRDRAAKILDCGLSHCSQVHELRMLAEMVAPAPSVSACMIVKNEEELLPACLDSIRDWVDEIVVVDTGSSDRTVEIAESYGAKVFHQPWEGDFSKHRNYSIDQATGEWIFIIDADERMTGNDIPVIRRHLKELAAEIMAVNILNVGGKYDEQVTFLPSIRFFRRDLGLRYEGIVHNQLKIDPTNPVLRTGVTIRHLGYGLSPEKIKAKAERTIGLLDRQLAENPDNPFALLNYAQVLLGLGLESVPDGARKVMATAGRAAELTHPDVKGERSIHLMTLQQLALVHFLVGNYDEAERFAMQVLTHKADYLDPILLLGNVYLRCGDLDRAEQYFQRYLTTQATYNESAETEDLIVVHPRSLHHAHYGLGVAAEQRHRFDAAGRHFETVLDTMPEFMDANVRLGFIRLRSNRLADAKACFEAQIQCSPDSHRAAVGLALIAFHNGELKEGEKWTTRALEAVPADSPDMLQHALSFEQIERPVEAGRFLAKAAAGNPDTATMQKLAESYFRLEQFETAAGLYEQLTAGNPTDGNLLNDLAGCYFRRGDYARAEEIYQRAVQQPQPPAIALRNLGVARIELGRLKEAVVVLERYIELIPEQAETIRLIGDIYFRLRDYSSALTYFEGLLQANPNDGAVLFALSECYLNMGHKDSAILGYRRVVQVEPDFELARQRIAELCEPVRNA